VELGVGWLVILGIMHFVWFGVLTYVRYGTILESWKQRLTRSDRFRIKIMTQPSHPVYTLLGALQIAFDAATTDEAKEHAILEVDERKLASHLRQLSADIADARSELAFGGGPFSVTLLSSAGKLVGDTLISLDLIYRPGQFASKDLIEILSSDAIMDGDTPSECARGAMYWVVEVHSEAAGGLWRSFAFLDSAMEYISSLAALTGNTVEMSPFALGENLKS
jgi:hypothetical protein